MFVKIPGTFLRTYASTIVDARKKAVLWLGKEKAESHVDIYKKRDDEMAYGYVQKLNGGVYMWVEYGPPERHIEIYRNGKLKR